MAVEPLSFTLQWSEETNPTGTVATGTPVGQPYGSGWLQFTPAFKAGSRIRFGNEHSITPRSFRAYLDTDGRLKVAKGASGAGVRLWGRDPRMYITRLQYHVTAPDGLRDSNKWKVPWLDFSFDAPDYDTTEYLAQLIPEAEADYRRGRSGREPRRAEYDLDSTELIFTMSNNSTIRAAMPPLDDAIAALSARAAAFIRTFGA